MRWKLQREFHEKVKSCVLKVALVGKSEIKSVMGSSGTEHNFWNSSTCNERNQLSGKIAVLNHNIVPHIDLYDFWEDRF